MSWQQNYNVGNKYETVAEFRKRLIRFIFLKSYNQSRVFCNYYYSNRFKNIHGSVHHFGRYIYCIVRLPHVKYGVRLKKIRALRWRVTPRLHVV